MFDNINYTPPNYSGELKFTSKTPAYTLIKTSNSREVIKITAAGEIYWNGRLVETDEDFKASMLELAEYLKGHWR